MSVFKYSVIRFRPFAETEEFANIGVIVTRVIDGKIGFKLAPRRFTRIRQFFDQVAYDAYDDVISYLQIELGRAAEYLPKFSTMHGSEIFNDVTRRRESSILFSNPRVTEHDIELDDLIDKFYDRFVKRENVTYSREEFLVRDIRRELRRAGINYFKSVKLNDDVVPVSFPLAYQAAELRAIKPLAFSQKSPMSVLDHGAHWRRRLGLLLDRRRISPGNVLLAVEPPPAGADISTMEAFDVARKDLSALPFKVIDVRDGNYVNHDVISFARHSVEAKPFFT